MDLTPPKNSDTFLATFQSKALCKAGNRCRDRAALSDPNRTPIVPGTMAAAAG